ncbi:DUF4382 domain-containing protein [Duganella sp. FT92W]|uniref:DUF4382 domain-containing protein n=1 Tax=Pseudoduganella rivuli TaxID=2666085 RepID=A0A7X2LT92_9BURK|nr:DUF4382 domain-containing protein [Pseudoduganella rivuli]MRV72723.1 DUF4382 domain-containing protein [Pseudoduganella rivuli]
MKFTVPALSLAAMAGLLTACGGGGGGSSTPTPTQMGSVAVSLTDAPACGFDAVNVTVSKVRIHQSSSASDTDSGWTDITLSPARKINLLNLNNGALEALGTASLGAGHYSQLRLVLGSGTNANTVVKTGTTTEVALDTPSALQSGIKLVNEFDVAAGQRVDLVLDFDACKSVVTRGNSGGYNLKPVVKVVPTALNGISGFVATAALGSHVAVSAQQNGVIVASTVPNATTGEFNLARLPAGNYDVVITGDGYAASVVGAVPVTASAMTQLSTVAAPIVPAVSLGRNISGSVTQNPVSSTEPAVVAAMQAISGGPTVTLKYTLTPIGGGAYTLAGLPVAAPRYVTYSGTLPLVFGAAATVPLPGQYRVDASAIGYTSKSAPLVDVSTADQANVNFTLTP